MGDKERERIDGLLDEINRLKQIITQLERQILSDG